MNRIEAEPLRDPYLHQFDNTGYRSFRIVRLHKVKVALGSGRAEFRHRALIDAMGIGDDLALGSLPEYLGEPHHWHRARRDDVGQHLARTDRRKLVDITNDQEGGLIWHCPQERLHQHDIDHRGLVDHQQVAIEGCKIADNSDPLRGIFASNSDPF